MRRLSLPVFACLLSAALVRGDDASRDVEVTIHVRRAFVGDRALRDLPIDIVVRDGEVTLSGSLESEQLSKRAERVAEGVQGVLRVRNKIKIGGTLSFSDWLPRPVVEAKPEAAPSLPALEEAPARLVHHIEPAATVTPPRSPLEPRSWSKPVKLRPPVARASAKREGATAPAKLTSLQREPSLPDRLLELRSSNPRFGALRLYLRNGMVIIRGTARNGQDLNVFARKASTMPGVTRVRIEDVEIGR